MKDAKKRNIIIPENPVSKYLFSSVYAAWIWLIIRLYVGYAWLTAGWHKVQSDAWTGENAGSAVQGFIKGALAKAAEGKDVTGWYAGFLENTVLPHAKIFGFLVAYGELLVGLGLIVGLLTGIAAFFGAVMNASFLFAGTLSTNPILFILATWLVLAWKNAGWYGLDRWVLPLLGTPWYRESSQNKNHSENI
ncbi:MAG TPA: DoxX family protein [Bacillales bacterium]|nr:DoxX family protein [Bacillales bacterium]